MLYKGERYDKSNELLHHSKKNYLIIVNKDTPLCPDCNVAMTARSSYPRKITDDSDKEHLFRLRLLKCPKCGKSHAEIPDCMMTFKHYSAAVIEKVLSGEIDYFPGDASTVYRWKKNNTHTSQ